MELWIWSPVVHKPGMVVHALNPRTQNVEVAGLEVPGHPWLCTEFETSMGYVKPCRKKTKQFPSSPMPAQTTAATKTKWRKEMHRKVFCGHYQHLFNKVERIYFLKTWNWREILHGLPCSIAGNWPIQRLTRLEGVLVPIRSWVTSTEFHQVDA